MSYNLIPKWASLHPSFTDCTKAVYQPRQEVLIAWRNEFPLIAATLFVQHPAIRQLFLSTSLGNRCSRKCNYVIQYTQLKRSTFRTQRITPLKLVEQEILYYFCTSYSLYFKCVNSDSIRGLWWPHKIYI